MPLTKTLQEHEAELVVVTNREAKATLRALADSEREILQALALSPDLLTRARLGALSQRLDTLKAALVGRLNATIDAATLRASTMTLAHTAALVSQAGTVSLTDAYRGRASVALAQQQGLLLHRHSVARYGASAIGRIQGDLVAGILQEEGQAQLVRRLRTRAFIANRRQAVLIVRMEMSAAYSRATGEQAAILYSEDTKWRKRIFEFFDANNHPFSRAAHGTMAKPGENYKVAVARVGKAGSKPLWRESRGFYRGLHLPAHFGERGREVVWHTSWVTPGSATP